MADSRRYDYLRCTHVAVRAYRLAVVGDAGHAGAVECTTPDAHCRRRFREISLGRFDAGHGALSAGRRHELRFSRADEYRHRAHLFQLAT